MGGAGVLSIKPMYLTAVEGTKFTDYEFDEK